MKLKHLFENESRFTSNAFARLRNGAECRWDDPAAYCFCLLGGLFRCYGGSDLCFDACSRIVEGIGQVTQNPSIYMAYPRSGVFNCRGISRKIPYEMTFIWRFSDNRGYDAVVQLVGELDV